MKNFSFLFGALAAVVLVALLLLVFGVRFTSDVMTYDPAKEIVLTGTVLDHAEFACPASDSELGEHILIKVQDKTYMIHLAPARVMRSLKWKFANGESIQVRGAQVSYRGTDGLIARQISRADEVFTFRDPNGTLLVKQ